MKYLFIAIVAALLWALPVSAQQAVQPMGADGINIHSATNPIYIDKGGVAQAIITNTTANVANSSTTVTLVAACRHIVIKTDPAAAVIYVDLAGGTATSADFRIEPGGALVYEGAALSSFKYLGASATGTISVCAW